MKSKPDPNSKTAPSMKSKTAPNLDQRVFLGLDRPPLMSAADWVVSTFVQKVGGQRQLDLSQVIIVVPTARAQQRVLQLLVGITDGEQTNFIPPTVTTLGHLPEFLYVAEKSLASELAQQIAWTKALADTPAAEIEKLTGRDENEPSSDWQPLAAMIAKLHTRLANDILSFRSVARAVAADKGFLKAEAVRWDALNEIQKRYYSILTSVDLWDKQAARNFAAGGSKANEIRCATDKTIVMLGTADLNQSVAEMLRQVAATNSEQVKILIAGPETWADRFDAFGSLIAEKWLDVPIAISDDKIRIVDQPADQAFATAHFLTHLENFAADEITIGVPDESVVPQLIRCLNSMELSHRHLAGRPLVETAPVRLLLACRDYLKDFSFDALGSLVRHPDMYRWLASQIESETWLTELAAFQNSNLPAEIGLEEKNPFGDPQKIGKRFDAADPGSQQRAKRNSESAARLNKIHGCLARLFLPLKGDAKPIDEWADPWTEVLLTIYGDREMSGDDPADQRTLIAFEAIYVALGEQRMVPSEFNEITTAMKALEWVLQAAYERRVVPPPLPTAIEMAGWLDLTLDDAPVMIVTGMNDEYVPTSEVGHQFLPNELCKQLGVLDNDRRFARDCYALSIITSVRENYQLIVGRRNESGEPLKPSRLLFADTPNTSALRARAFFNYGGKSETRYWLADQEMCQADQQFPIPRPVVTKPVTQISVTKFRDFIKCPYRFYLNHVLRLESLSDDWRELDAGKFGDLTHHCLEAFGKSDVRDSTNEEVIFEFLMDGLNTYAKQQLGGVRLPAVRIQLEQIRLRFERFAPKQAAQRADGWRIVSTEEMLEHDFDVDGQPFRIRGKIDRVDQHEVSNQIAVWDYKSSDKGDPPEKVHYASRKQEWKDLQLPLYRHLVKEVSAVAGSDFSNIVTGYILLPKKLDDVNFYPTDWNADQLASADETARSILRRLRQSDFWPPTPKPPLYSEEYSAICQDNVFEQFEIVEYSQNKSAEVAPW